MLTDNPETIAKLNSLPLVDQFNSLKIGDDVYSRKYGLGKFAAVYLDDAVADFNGRKIRISPKNNDLSLVSPESGEKRTEYLDH